MFRLALLLVLTALSGTHAASCVSVFGYERVDGVVYGVLSVTPPPSYVYGTEFEVTLELVIGASVSRDAPMGLRLADSASSSASNLRRNLPVWYRVHFPVQSPLAKVKSVKVNGRDICTENPEVTGPTRITITLSHTLQLAAMITATPAPRTPAPERLISQRDQLINPQTPQAPTCGRYFHLERRAGDIGGVVLAPPPSVRNPGDPVTIRVRFYVPAMLTNGNTGSLGLEESLTTVADRLRAGRSDVIRYRATLPAQTPVPQVIALEVNGRTVCSEEPTYQRPYTIYSQGHTIYP